jgi:hypothetical protein
MEKIGKKRFKTLQKVIGSLDVLVKNLRHVCAVGNKKLGVQSYDEARKAEKFSVLINRIQFSGAEQASKELTYESLYDFLQLPNAMRPVVAKLHHSLSQVGAPPSVSDHQKQNVSIKEPRYRIALEEWNVSTMTLIKDGYDRLDALQKMCTVIRTEWDRDGMVIDTEEAGRSQWLSFTTEQRTEKLRGTMDKVMTKSTTDHFFNVQYYEMEMKRVRAYIRLPVMEQFVHDWRRFEEILHSLGDLVGLMGGPVH